MLVRNEETAVKKPPGGQRGDLIAEGTQFIVHGRKPTKIDEHIQSRPQRRAKGY
jgi:hypothetical protein